LVVRWNSEAGSTDVHSAGAIWRLPARRNSACNKEAVLLSSYGTFIMEKEVFIEYRLSITDVNE
jgi:hypothetical protein